MRALRIAALLLAGAGGALAQSAPTDELRGSDILTIDQDRLFAQTRLGLRSTAAIETDAAALAEENRRIEEELAAEERALTEDRRTLDAAEFTELANAFDQKVQRIRTEQDAKARALSDRQEEARQAFFVEIGGILSDIVRERGAVVILDRRDIFLSADRIDITDEAIARINAMNGDPEVPLDAPTDAPADEPTPAPE